MSELDVIGALTGTDKCSSISWGWDYLRHYEELFGRWRYSNINLIEIGVAGGASLAAWARYFDRANLVGIDVNRDCLRFARDRIFIRIGSQDDPGFLHSVTAEFPPTIIIDDGSHITHHMIASFETLFPVLLPGGIYVFEDLGFHFEDGEEGLLDAKTQQGLAESSIYEYLNRFIRARAANIAVPSGSWGFARYAFENIDSITVVGGIIAVRKRAPRDVDYATSVFERELKMPQYDTAVIEHRYAEYLMRHNVYLDRAAALLKNILYKQSSNEPALDLLFNLLVRLERWDEASDAANRLAASRINNVSFWEQLAEVERRRGRPDQEILAVRRLTDLQPDSAQNCSRLCEISEALGDHISALDAARRALALQPGDSGFADRVIRLENSSR